MNPWDKPRQEKSRKGEGDPGGASNPPRVGQPARGGGLATGAGGPATQGQAGTERGSPSRPPVSHPQPTPRSFGKNPTPITYRSYNMASRGSLGASQPATFGSVWGMNRAYVVCNA